MNCKCHSVYSVFLEIKEGNLKGEGQDLERGLSKILIQSP
jgi:hypothetical protein